MRVLIFHYHLNPGGVTRIIESQVEALLQLDEPPEILLLTGHCDNITFYESKNVSVIINEALNYLTERKDYDATLKEIDNVFSDHLRKGDILHFHNLNLGKNPLVTLLVSEYVQRGFKIINHAHDFSEDRPINQQYLKEIIEEKHQKSLQHVMYPQQNNYHYAVLNSFDRNRLVNMGVPSKRISFLPNPVVFNMNNLEGSIDEWKKEIVGILNADVDKPIITYPVRVIRRKNIGEFILLASLFDEANWIVTQPPKNPVEIEPYKYWVEFAKEHNIAIYWEAGTKVNFEKLLRSSDFCISTSFQEGFGMVFMEPWLLETPVIGRNIPMVTEDMINSGMEFTCLYDKLLIYDDNQLHELSQEEQMQHILRIKNDDTAKSTFINKNPFIKNLLNMPAKDLITRNKEVILKNYSLNNYGKRLDEVYRKIVK